MKDKPVVGQKMFTLNIGNRARNCEQKLTEVVVTKVGRLYFTVKKDLDSYCEEQFHLSDWKQKTSCSRDHEIFATENEWEDMKKSKDICGHIRMYFKYGDNSKNLSISQLERIKAILDEVTP